MNHHRVPIQLYPTVPNSPISQAQLDDIWYFPPIKEHNSTPSAPSCDDLLDSPPVKEYKSTPLASSVSSSQIRSQSQAAGERLEYQSTSKESFQPSQLQC